MADLGELVQAIVDDQFERGEFGSSEDFDRIEATAAAKPNFFISCQAAFALVAVEAQRLSRLRASSTGSGRSAPKIYGGRRQRVRRTHAAAASRASCTTCATPRRDSTFPSARVR
jgi:hypothetical protein